MKLKNISLLTTVVFISIFMFACSNGNDGGSILPPAETPILNSVSEAVGNYVGDAQETASPIANAFINKLDVQLSPNIVHVILRVEEGSDGRIEGGFMTQDGLYFYEGSLNLQDGTFSLTAEDDPDAIITGSIDPKTKCLSGQYSYEDDGELKEGTFNLCQDDSSISNVYCFSTANNYGEKDSFLAGLLVYDENGLSDKGHAIWATEDDETEEIVWLEGQFDGVVLNLQNGAINVQGTNDGGTFWGEFEDKNAGDDGVWSMAKICTNPVDGIEESSKFKNLMKLQYRNYPDRDEKRLYFSLVHKTGDEYTFEDYYSKIPNPYDDIT